MLLVPTLVTVWLCVVCLRVCSIRPGLLSAVLITETRLTAQALSLGLSSLNVVSKNGESGRLSVKLLGRLIASVQLTLGVVLVGVLGVGGILACMMMLELTSAVKTLLV